METTDNLVEDVQDLKLRVANLETTKQTSNTAAGKVLLNKLVIYVFLNVVNTYYRVCQHYLSLKKTIPSVFSDFAQNSV